MYAGEQRDTVGGGSRELPGYQAEGGPATRYGTRRHAPAH